MAFSEQHDHIAFFCIFNTVADRFFSVIDLDIFSVAFRKSDLDIVVDIGNLLVSWIVTGEHTEIRHLARNLSHVITAQFGTVSASAVNTDQPFRMVLKQRCEHASGADLVVRVIDDECKFVRHRNHLHSALDLYLA